MSGTCLRNAETQQRNPQSPSPCSTSPKTTQSYFPRRCPPPQSPAIPPDGVVLEMAESPTQDYKSKRITLGSASSWTVVELGEFHVDFNPDQYSPLPDSVLQFDPGSLDSSAASSNPESDLEKSNTRYADCAINLTHWVEIKSLRKKAFKIDKEKHLRQQEDPKNFERHPFCHTIEALRNCLTQISQEAHDRVSEQAIKPPSTSSTAALPRLPSTISVTPQKRNVSDSSFGTHSTDTTPTKWVKPEASIQHLQNLLVSEVLFHLHRGKVPINWVRGRPRPPFMQYNVYLSLVECSSSTHSRSSKTSFKCFTRNNHSTIPDSVTVISDGVLRIVKWKSASRTEETTIEWNKQPVSLAFEVFSPLATA